MTDKEKTEVVVTEYDDFRKIVCEQIKQQHGNLKTDKDVEKFIDNGGGEGVIKSAFNENKKDFAEGKYVYSTASAVAMNLD